MILKIKNNINFLISAAVVLMVICSVPALAVECTDAGCEHVAAIGSEHYDSIQKAVEAAEDGDTVTVIKEHDIDSADTVTFGGKYTSLVLVTGKSVTIDLNGKKICSEVEKGTLYAFFATEKNGHLTLVDNAGDGCAELKALEQDVIYSLIMCYDDTCTITVNSGKYTANDVTSALFYSQVDEKITVNNGTFILGNVGTESNGSPWIFNASGQNTKNIIVNGGTFNDDVLHQYYPFEVVAPKERALRNNGNGTYTMVDAVAYVNEQEWSGGWYTNEIGYATFEEAVQAANDNSNVGATKSNKKNTAINTLTIISDCTAEEPVTITRDVTITGTGTVTAKASPMIQVGDGITLTIKSGEFQGIISEGNGTVVIDPEEEAAIGFIQDVTPWLAADSGLLSVTYVSEGKAAGNQIVKSGTIVSAPVKATKTGYTLFGWYKDKALTEIYEFDAPVTESITLYAKWEIEKQANWTYTTDAGYYVTADTAYGMIRFLFKADIEGEVTKFGIKYIKGSDITADIAKESSVSSEQAGDAKAFYGDIVKIKENSTDTYFAIAYVEVDGKTYWSEVVSCTPNWSNNYTGYAA